VKKILSGCLLFGLAALLALPAYGTSPGRNGQIVYSVNSPRRLWVSNPDGTGERKLTTTKGRFDDAQPDWSPDGSKIAFERCGQGCNVWSVNANGTGFKRLNACDCGQPAWAPDGKQLAVSRGFGGVANDQIRFAEIFVLNAGGSLRQVTKVTSSSPYSADVEHPAWSPDGRRLVFEVHNSPKGQPAGKRALFVIDATGSGQRQLTPWSLNGSDPDWSPDGKLILFRSVSGREQHGNLYTVSTDGSGPKQLTRYPSPKAVFAGSFSPDGKWITFSRFSSSYYPAVFVMHVDGTGLKQVSKGRYEVDADWGRAR
jgi:TolB protein